MPSKRQLAAIMFTDISGFSAMMQEDEVYAKTILSRQRQVMEAKHRDFDGKILQYVGDGTLSIFQSSVAAVECAVAIQVELRRDPYVPLRIGIHTGDITYDNTGAFGDGVNVASRVERICLPGAVYITEKVFDDIKNHPWLTAIRLGTFKLHNIAAGIGLYAINAKNLVLPEKTELMSLPEYETAFPIGAAGRKDQKTAAMLALILGIFGAHRFYLGQRSKGVLYLVAFGFAMMITTQGDVPAVAIIAIIAFIDAVLLFVMPKEDFNRKYNQGLPAQDIPYAREAPAPSHKKMPSKTSTLKTTFNNGKRLYEKGRFEQAIDWFDQVLDIDEEYAEAHYHLAACFSVLKDTENAFIHLALAVKYGFSDFEKIEKDINFYYLRSLPEYPAFRANGYKLVEALPEPQKDLLTTDRFDPEILEKIELLGDQLERGELTQQEFQLRKEKILRGE